MKLQWLNQDVLLVDWWIYHARDPRTEETRYVGASHDLEQRLGSMRRSARSGSDRPSHAWVRELEDQELEPELVPVRKLPAGMPISEAKQAEIEEIAKQRDALGDRLLNVTEGGERIGRKHGKAARRKMSEAMSEAVRGDNHPMKRPEVREKVSQALQGRVFSEEHKLHISEAKKDKHIGEKNPHAKVTAAEVRQIRELYATGDQFQRALAERFGVTETQIRNIVKGRAWAHVVGPIKGEDY